MPGLTPPPSLTCKRCNSSPPTIASLTQSQSAMARPPAGTSTSCGASRRLTRNTTRSSRVSRERCHYRGDDSKSDDYRTAQADTREISKFSFKTLHCRMNYIPSMALSFISSLPLRLLPFLVSSFKASPPSLPFFQDAIEDCIIFSLDDEPPSSPPCFLLLLMLTCHRFHQLLCPFNNPRLYCRIRENLPR